MENDLKKIKFYFSISLLLVAIIWTIKGIEITTSQDFSYLGIYPRHLSGLKGILFMPLIHSNVYHLFNNSLATLFFLTALLYFYPKQSLKIVVIAYFLPSLIVWLIGRQAYHIGLSAFLFTLASYQLFMAIFTKKRELMAFAFIIIFVYGGSFWTIFPSFGQISWEGHLAGFLVGSILALIDSKPKKVLKSNISVSQIVKFVFSNSTSKKQFHYFED